jgi:hypothetical protein
MRIQGCGVAELARQCGDDECERRALQARSTASSHARALIRAITQLGCQLVTNKLLQTKARTATLAAASEASTGGGQVLMYWRVRARARARVRRDCVNWRALQNDEETVDRPLKYHRDLRRFALADTLLATHFAAACTSAHVRGAHVAGAW